ncbi:hypothetical protein ACIGXI_26210 [Kitasatospora aureofaciens]|uniref:hypothetical protein n=1 Tax=Kitasatospora aureofaciens TaxID=1894 RepID=UPI0037C9AB1B
MTTADHDPGTETFLTAEGSVFTAQDLSRARPLYRLTTLQYDVWHTVLGEMTLPLPLRMGAAPPGPTSTASSVRMHKVRQ